VTGLVARLERFAVVSSTNDVVRDWLAAGVPEVCVAVADHQQAGRGRQGRSWVAPAGTGLLLSLGTRPAWIDPGRAWRVAAVVSLAAAEAAEAASGLAPGTIRLKWPNDLVVDEHAAGGDDDGDGRARTAGGRAAAPCAGCRKLGGVLAEGSDLGGPDPRLVVGLGLNVDWEAGRFPPDLAAAMTSLRVLAGRPVSREDVLAAFLERAKVHLDALRDGRFALDGWAARQLLPGTSVRLTGSGGADGEWRVLAVDDTSGALVVADPAAAGGERRVMAGEAVHVRPIDGPGAGRATDRPAVAAAGRV
jgi:BirA family biotin operon repressor/biotin-[acetyl-CoA-carboxylase] ligase